MGLPRGSRLLLLARAYARGWRHQGHLHARVPGRQVGAHSKRECNHGMIRFQSGIEKRLAEQELKIIGMEGELNVLEGKIVAQAEVFKKQNEKDAKALNSAMDDVKFSILKGAGAFLGLTAAIGSVVANMSRISAWFSGGKGSA